jgi:hypothetical protein
MMLAFAKSSSGYSCRGKNIRPYEHNKNIVYNPLVDFYRASIYGTTNRIFIAPGQQ